MKELDVITLHQGLQSLHSLDATDMSDKSSTSLVQLVTPQGLPLKVGWFDNSRKSLSVPSAYAITSYPEQPRHMHHRLLIEQFPGESSALSYEEDSDGYLEGYDPFPSRSEDQLLIQPDLQREITRRLLGACILTTTTGKELGKFAWTNACDVEAVRQFGQALISSGNYLSQVDQAMLDTITTGTA